MPDSALTVDLETAGLLEEAGGEGLRLCYLCGSCISACPWNRVRQFDVRKMIHQAQLGLVDLENEVWWLCASCRACIQQCPQGVGVIEIMRASRRIIVELGVASIPDSIRISLKNISGVGNPMGEYPERRQDWSKDLNVRTFTADKEFLYFTCCVPAYDAKVRRVARSLVTVFGKVGASFGALGSIERCCGESVRKAGDENLFQSLAQSNINAFREHGVTKVVVSSPHCYHAFKNEYPELGADFEVMHYTQYLAELIKEGRLQFSKELRVKVAYHDPCYLGRHNSIYDEPREILQCIPGLELIELPDFRESSFCCGGGGGRIWAETKKGERFSDLRVEQAIEVGADILATSCPYCMLNFDDSVLSMDKADVVQIKDIAELVLEALD